MKKYIISLVALLTLVSGQAFATQGEGSGGPNAKREISGAPGFVPYKEYQLVRYGENGPNSATLSAGDVVTWDCVSDDGVTIGLVGAVNSVDAVAGVVVSTVINTVEVTGTTPGVDYGRRNWGYIQVRGLSTKVNVTGGSAVVGSSLVASATARYATAALPINGGQRNLGFAYDASEQGNSSDVMITL